MYVYRLCRSPFATLDGDGSWLYGGRWNSPGRRIVYTSETLALAALEALVHFAVDVAPTDLVALTIKIPDDLVHETIALATLPAGWAQYVDTAECRVLGDRWADSGKTPLLRVPAAPVPQEHNILINAAHSESSRIRVIEKRPFHFDPRLLK
ncbi:MAG: RES family NAD+ phosphorylase [Gemmatimonadaceae bacterium]